jgi:predicted esterase
VWRRTSTAAFGALLVCVACGDQIEHVVTPDSGVVEPFPVHAIFEVPREGEPPPTGFYGLPFPNDVRVGADGEIDLSDHPKPNDLIALYLDTVQAQQRGFGLSSAGYLLFDGPIDASSLPWTPGGSRLPQAAVYLVDIDPDSPEYGRQVPTVARFSTQPGEAIAANWLSVLPYPGFVLRETTTYALVATRRLTTRFGDAVEPAVEFQVIGAADVPEDPALARAQSIYAPLWAWLDLPGGDERADVVSAAVFTTQDATSLLARVREVIYRDLPVPRPKEVYQRAVVAGFAWIDGTFDGPNFQKGDSPYLKPEDGGAFEIDAESGEPVLQSIDELRFSLTVPLGPMPEAGWPVVLYAHGTGGDYHSFVYDGTASRLAEKGMAVLSMDQVLHGARNRTVSPDLAFFNLQNPLAVRDNALQGALDDFQLLRLARNFDVQIRTTEGRHIKLDRDQITFFGHSQGSLTGIPFVAHEPLVKGAVFSGAGGLLYLSLLHKTKPLDIAGIVGLVLRDDPLDQFNPFLALMQMYLDRADSASYGRLLISEPLDGTPQNVFLSEGITDRYTPVPSIEALATAMRIAPVGPVLRPVVGLQLAGIDVIEAPVSGNVDGTVTAGLLQYQEAADSDGHFVIFEVDAARRQSGAFLRTLIDEGQARIPP